MNYAHPAHGKPVHELLRDLPKKDESMCRVLPFPLYPPSDNPWLFPRVPIVPQTLTFWRYPLDGVTAGKKHTRLMTILNTTPDSFSDGGCYNTLSKALKYASEAVESGACIIDIGGYSTRPGAASVESYEETERVVPIIQAIRKKTLSEIQVDGRLAAIPISVDTFRPDVAESSIRAGASCINDVYAFSGYGTYPFTDEEAKAKAERTLNAMKRIARNYAVPVILMHSRGDAGQHKDYNMYINGRRGSVVYGVQLELGNKVGKIIKGKGGVRRWMVIVDPGIGFSKSLDGNLELLRDASRIVTDVIDHDETRNPLRGFPLLIGPSRKAFLGMILSQAEQGRDTSPKERAWATAAAVACAIQQGAMIVRIHDTKEMADVAAVADQIWG